jgi:MFS-type transporter involved in bile tolerance (Atg22 family)
LTLSDASREAAAVVFGGLIIGGILTQQFRWQILGIGIVVYLLFIALALYFKKKGE